MLPRVPSKRNCPAAGEAEMVPAHVPSALPASDGDDGMGPNIIFLTHARANLWSGIRGAMKAIGRASRSGESHTQASCPPAPIPQPSRHPNGALPSESESSPVLDWSAARNRAVQGKGKSVIGERGFLTPPLTPRKAKGLVPRDLFRRIGHGSGFDSGTTVVLRGSPLKRRTSLQALAGTRSGPDHSSETSSSASSGDSGNWSATETPYTGEVLADSHSPDTASVKVALGRDSSRRHPLSKSSPGGATARTIDEVFCQPRPTVLTVEKAAAARIYVETHYNNLLNKPSGRELRKRYLESQLYYCSHLTADQKDAVRFSFYQQETSYTRQCRVLRTRSMAPLRENSTAQADRYECLKILGRGSFGVVKLVRENEDEDEDKPYPRQVFAMKRGTFVPRGIYSSLLKAQTGALPFLYPPSTHRAKQQRLTVGLFSSPSRRIVPLVASFQDLRSLYLVMEYMPGGDFLGLLIRENILHESVARFYIAEMVLAVEEAHRLKFIHRDIKPDNFLISASGHLKISDFGLAFDGHWSHDASYFNYHRYSLLRKLGIRVDGDTDDQKKCEIVSTQPSWLQSINEVIERHDRRDDLSKNNLSHLLGWRNRCGNRDAAHSVVGTSQYMAPEVIRACRGCEPHVSEKCKDLVYGLIQDKETRLCSTRYETRSRAQINATTSVDFFGRFVFPDDAEDIKAHRWFKNFPWEHIHAMSPPFVPRISSMDDTHYFEESEPVEDFSDSSPEAIEVTDDDVRSILYDLRRVVQDAAIDLISAPYDSARLRSADHQIDIDSHLTPYERKVLKHFIRIYGKKERKRPRDILLRDENTKDVVMDVRKKTAFLGYSWRRMRPGGYCVIPT
ncbi:kinase domain containing protein [Drechmeria coniospora]|uniref:non-specific serine/threonine protein kinase n=1 Tax=Drechmeria coniospora TaxID=98403 RepID=A0A151GEP9_DRECN|nr:kinase domain containing protein [Drechmeria coniospora]KYK55565.1 kinase domain containing protein [Drechmeria coniospora]